MKKKKLQKGILYSVSYSTTRVILFRNFSINFNFFDSAAAQVLEASHVEDTKPHASHSKEKQSKNCYHVVLPF